MTSAKPELMVLCCCKGKLFVSRGILFGAWEVILTHYFLLINLDQKYLGKLEKVQKIASKGYQRSHIMI